MVSIEHASKALNLEVFTKPAEESLISGGYTSDLLSDVMANATEGGALITIQGHKNAVAVASLVSLNAIILCNGRQPTADMVATAQEEGIAILGSQEDQFTVSYRLAKLLGLCN
jgi:predicted transcriptional regulator